MYNVIFTIPLNFQLYAAPSAPPDQVSTTEIHSDSVYLSWRAPLPIHHNGDVIGYNVTYSATNSDAVDSVFSAFNNTVITYLNPFTTYTITVAAVTSAGIGPYSSPLSFVTDEAGIVINYIPMAMVY